MVPPSNTGLSELTVDIEHSGVYIAWMRGDMEYLGSVYGSDAGYGGYPLLNSYPGSGSGYATYLPTQQNETVSWWEECKYTEF